MTTVAEYLKRFRNIIKARNEDNGTLRECLRHINIALLSSFTCRGLAETISVMCDDLRVQANIYEGAYNQVHQEAINPDGALYAFKPDIIFVLLDFATAASSYYYNPYSFDADARRQIINNIETDTAALVTVLQDNIAKTGHSATIVISGFAVPDYSPLGILDSKQDYGYLESVRDLNARIEARYRLSDTVFVFDYDAFAARIGKVGITDNKMYYLGDMRIGLTHIPALAQEYMGYIKPRLYMSKKCLVLDLDNTLWGGVIGEDGVDGIKLSPHYEGKAYYDLQRYILALYTRGCILAINSKNNWDDVKEVFDRHPYMLLGQEHFAAVRVNWQDKASNLREIASELNIGLDSIVFIDDDKLNREIVRTELPEVLTPELPDDPVEYAAALKRLNDFNTFSITGEDMSKGRMYAEQRVRNELKHSSVDMRSYLEGLGTTLVFDDANESNLARIAQLTQKTNQFNMTSRRYTADEIRSKISAGGGAFAVYAVSAADRLGDNGISGVIMLERRTGPDPPDSRSLRIHNLLLSCRVLGRNIEQSALSFIADIAFAQGIKIIEGEFIPTAKNSVSKDFYAQSGFTLTQADGDPQIWVYNTGSVDGANAIACPDYIKYSYRLQKGKL